jgi:hypothetical protein
VFLPRLLRPLYNPSAFHTTALTCLKSPVRKLHSFAAPTYDNLSVHVMEAARRSFHLSLSRGEAISFAPQISYLRLASSIENARKHSCQCLSIDLALHSRCFRAWSRCWLYVKLFFERVLLVCPRLLLFQ